MVKTKQAFGTVPFGHGFFGETDYDRFTPTFLRHVNNPHSQWVYIVEFESPIGMIYYSNHPCSFLDDMEYLRTTLLKVNMGNLMRIQLGAGKVSTGRVSCTFDLDKQWRRLLTLRLYNKRVEIKIGPVGDDVQYSDFFSIFEGRLTNWKSKNHQVTVEFSDLFSLTRAKQPTKKTLGDGTNEVIPIIFRNDHIMTCLNKVLKLSVDATAVNDASMKVYYDTWLPGAHMNRVLVEPTSVKQLIDELADEAGGYLYQLNQQLHFKKVNPPGANETLKEFVDDDFKSFEVKGAGYRPEQKGWYNQVDVHWDYKEEGDDPENDYESHYILNDYESQARWEEVRTKVVKRRWLRTYSFSQPKIGYYTIINNSDGTLVENYFTNYSGYEGDATNGLIVYAVGYANMAGGNYVKNLIRGRVDRGVFKQRLENRAFIKWKDVKKEGKRYSYLQYMPPGTREVVQSGDFAGRPEYWGTDSTGEGGWGPPQKVTKSGKYTLTGVDPDKWIKVWINLHWLRRKRCQKGYAGSDATGGMGYGGWQAGYLPEKIAHGDSTTGFDCTAYFVISKCTGTSARDQAIVTAQNILRRYGDPRITLKFQTDISDGVAHQGKIVHAGQSVNVTTDRAMEKDNDELVETPFLLTSVKHDFDRKVSSFDAFRLALLGTGRYGYIGPDSLIRGLDATKYDDVISDWHTYCYIADENLTVGANSDDPYLIFPG